MAYGFFGHDQLEAEILQTQAAVLFISPHEQQALLSGFEESFLVATNLFTPAFHMRFIFGLHEAPHLVTEQFVFFLEYQSLHAHGFSLIASQAAAWGAG
jgi:hypothetical protein